MTVDTKVLNYTPDQDIQVHTENAIKLICAAFQSHESGLPEWPKNAADEYVRTDAPEDERVIVVLLDAGRGGREPSIACLDFGGMTSTVIEDYFRVWADPEAARRDGKANMQGGHGNGAKCYMTQMFEEYALLHTVKDNLGCKYGVESGTARFGYVPDADSGRDYAVAEVREELDSALASIGTSVDQLPQAAQQALGTRQGFTLVIGRGPKGYGRQIPYEPLLDSFRDHPQMIQTLELCSVYVMNNGAPVESSCPITLAALSPDAGFAEPRVIPVPEQVIDPKTGQGVSTTADAKKPSGELVLRTSNVSMRSKRKGRHTIVYRAESGFIGYCPINELDVQSSFKERIYGDCTLMSLEPTKQNERARLAQTPLTRALESFIAEQVQALALEFEAREKRSYTQAEKDGLSKINEVLDNWKNQFLTGFMKGLWGPGGDGGPTPPPPLPTGTPVRIEVHLGQERAGIGVALRPAIHFFDRDERRIRPVPYEWTSDDNNVAMVDTTLNLINTFSPGKTKISARTLDGALVSNAVDLQVVKIRSITLDPETVEIPVGSRKGIEANCELSNNEVVSGVSLVWTEGNPAIARVSSSGMVFGFELGETEVTAGDDRCWAKSAVKLRVVPAEGKGQGDQKGGRGFPRILVSGVDEDPDTGELITLSVDDPPVYQRLDDVDRNIWWINSSSPLARLYLDTSVGYGYKTREWRIYHIERYIDVMVQIALTFDPDQGAMGANDWIMRWGERVVAIQSAAASSLAGFIQSGDTSAVAGA